MDNYAAGYDQAAWNALPLWQQYQYYLQGGAPQGWQPPAGTQYYGGTGQYSVFNPTNAPTQTYGTPGYQGAGNTADGQPTYGDDTGYIDQQKPYVPSDVQAPSVKSDAPAPTTPTASGDFPDDASILAQIAKWADMPGADPSLKNDPNYWLGAIKSRGGLNAGNLQYWQDASVGPSAFFNNPNRESGGNTTTVGTGGGLGSGDANWFSANSPAAASYSTLARPDYLAQPYTPAKWSETFAAPTSDDLLKDPGYQAGADLLQKGLERGAAAKGSILSGGFAGIAEPRALANYAGTAYQNLFGRAYDTYQQRYNQFRDAQSADLAARGINESSYQTDVGNNQNQYLNRYNAYQDAIKNNFNLAQLGLNATNAGSPGTPI